MKSLSLLALDQLSEQARNAPRLRKNLNLHDDLTDPIQRLCNALEPGTYVRPHRHPIGVWECFVLLRGTCSVLLFDADGQITEMLDLTPDTIQIAEIPADSWHSVVARAPGTAVLEIKPGPYVPGTFASWAPEEGLPLARSCLTWMENAKTGERFTHD